jgi:hypothetical protein
MEKGEVLCHLSICGKTGGIEDRRDINICNTKKPESTIN